MEGLGSGVLGSWVVDGGGRVVFLAAYPGAAGGQAGVAIDVGPLCAFADHRAVVTQFEHGAGSLSGGRVVGRVGLPVPGMAQLPSRASSPARSVA